jgi:hypothetical protein
MFEAACILHGRSFKLTSTGKVTTSLTLVLFALVKRSTRALFCVLAGLWLSIALHRIAIKYQPIGGSIVLNAIAGTAILTF